jgi:hypothetical protein
MLDLFHRELQSHSHARFVTAADSGHYLPWQEPVWSRKRSSGSSAQYVSQRQTRTGLAIYPVSGRPFRAENGLWSSGNAVVSMVMQGRGLAGPGNTTPMRHARGDGSAVSQVVALRTDCIR